jgi:hypothetical protein
MRSYVIFSLAKYVGDEKVGRGRARITYRRKRNSYRISVKNHKRKRPLGRLRSTRDYNFEMDL